MLPKCIFVDDWSDAARVRTFERPQDGSLEMFADVAVKIKAVRILMDALAGPGARVTKTKYTFCSNDNQSLTSDLSAKET